MSSVHKDTDREPVLLRLAVDDLLEVSDMLDTQLALRLAAFREGFAAAQLEHADDYSVGFYDGAIARKHAQHDLRDLVELEAKRWGPGGREHFGAPRPGESQGSPLPLEMPSYRWLAGPVVHYHECTAACRSYKPGLYKVPDTQGGAA